MPQTPKKLPRSFSFAEKTFEERKSMLSAIDQNGFGTVINIFLALLIFMAISISVDEYFETGSIIPDVSMLIWCFSRLDIVIAVNMANYAVHFSVIPLVQFIHAHKVTKLVWLPMILTIHVLIYVIGCGACFYWELPPASAMVVTCEMARISMKTHAYFREKLLYGMGESEYSKFVPKFATDHGATQEHLNKPTIVIGTASEEFYRLLYFFYAPTLIYRDKYVRALRTNWAHFFTNLINMLVMVVYCWAVFKSMAVPLFKDTALHPFSLRHFIQSCIFSTLSGIIILCLGFFGVLHSWLNMFAELTRFADRRFYEDWWNVGTFASYYRKWNIVVHEFLYYYVYNDAIRFSRGAISRSSAKNLVFLFSAIVHEIIVTCALGFFYPVLLLMFGGPGVIFVKIQRSESKAMNVLFWFLIMIGCGLLMVMYSREFYARHLPQAATIARDGIWKALYPQSLRFIYEHAQSS